MDYQLTLTLEKPARKSGGDKYVAKDRDDFTIYVPQDISRTNGRPAATISIILRNGDDAVAAEV